MKDEGGIAVGRRELQIHERSDETIAHSVAQSGCHQATIASV